MWFNNNSNLQSKVESSKWNEMNRATGYLCEHITGLNWARKTSWGWWDEWDDTVLQTQDSKFEPWRSEAEYATSRSRRLPTIMSFTRGWGRTFFCFFQTAVTGNRTPNSGVKGSGANHYPRATSFKFAVQGWIKYPRLQIWIYIRQIKECLSLSRDKISELPSSWSWYLK